MIRIPETSKKKPIQSMEDLDAKLMELEKRTEKSPDDQRTERHARTLKQLVTLNDDFLEKHPDVEPPPVYEALSERVA